MSLLQITLNISQFSILLVLLLIPFIWVRIRNKLGFVESLKNLGVHTNSIKMDLLFGLFGFLLLFLLVFVSGIITTVAGVNDTAAVETLLKEQSLLFLFFILAVQVPAEEFFFRGFLTPRTGVILSSVLFGIAHAGYGSYVEIMVAILAGIILAYIYKERGNIVAPIIAHELFNLLSLATLVIV
ncbi:MAG: CPBP family intramembrane metalloprotease [Candidatus Diapherotrites archaeon]|nr:CPBP family intramembrane metalloprotease [Candidatus Diapherotrites archaeon]